MYVNTYCLIDKSSRYIPAAGPRVAAHSKKQVANKSCMSSGAASSGTSRLTGVRTRNTGHSGTLSARRPGSHL